VLSDGGEQPILFSDFLHLRVPSVEEPGVGVTQGYCNVPFTLRYLVYVQAMLRDKELQTNYSERKCWNYCRGKELVTGCYLDNCCTCCLLWNPVFHTCGTWMAEENAGYPVEHYEMRCCLDCLFPFFCCGPCIYAYSTKRSNSHGDTTATNSERALFTPIDPPGTFVIR
jgi:hypothetical protein